MAFKRKKFTRKSRKPKGKKMKAIKKLVSKMITKKAEPKALITWTQEQTINTYTSPDSTLHYPILDKPDQGVKFSERIGDRIEARYLDLRGHIINTNSTSIITRILVFWQHSQDNALSDCIEDSANSYTPVGQGLESIYARFNVSKYKLLADKRIQTLGGGIIQAKMFNIRIKLKNKKVRWDQGETNPEDQLRLIYYSRRMDNDDNTTGLPVEITWNAKFGYTDL